MTTMDNFQQIFDSKSQIYLDIVNEILCEVNNIEYNYTYLEHYTDLMRNNIFQGYKIYWTEIINNAHAASLLSMQRHKHWISGIIESFKNNNYLSFSANLRGLLESVADSNYSLLKIPTFLSKFSVEIEKAIKELDKDSDEDFKIYLCSDLEEALLHFAYARKLSKNESAPKYHKAETNTDYINTLTNTNFLKLYSELCQITHPAMPSVMDYFDVVESPKGYTNRINFINDKDNELITRIIKKYQNELNELLSIGFDYPIAILKEINKLNFEPLYIKTIDKILYQKK